MVSLSPLFPIVVGTNVEFGGHRYVVQIGELRDHKARISIIESENNRQFNVTCIIMPHLQRLEFDEIDEPLIDREELAKQPLTQRLTECFGRAKSKAILSSVICQASEHKSSNPGINTLMQQIKSAASEVISQERIAK